MKSAKCKMENKAMREKIFSGKNLVLLSALSLLVVILFSKNSYGQEEDLGNKQYIIVKDYKPILAESYKISDQPELDTSSTKAPEFQYTIAAGKLETSYETAVIKPVNIKDESIQKLYRTLIKLGIGNYSTYNGELFLNSLRSKEYTAGLHLKHFSASPNLKDVGEAGFSTNAANLYGKYFLEKATLSGDLLFSRDVYHYYGFSTSDTIIDDTKYKQRFSLVDFKLGIEKRDLAKSGMDYSAFLKYSALNDVYDAQENDFTVSGHLGRKFSGNYGKVNISLDYFKKGDARLQLQSGYTNRARNIISLEPMLVADKEKMHLELGANLAMEKNTQTDFHAYPNIKLELPVAENVLSVFGSVTGRLIKNNYTTISRENPFISSFIDTINNTSEKINLKAGIKGNASPSVTFGAYISHASYNNMLLFVNDADSVFPSRFNLVFDDGTITTLHAEVGYRNEGKFSVAFHFDQYIYKMEHLLKAWHKPANEITLSGRYNLRDKILVTMDLFFRGPQYARELDASGFDTAVKLKGYADINLGAEYRYSKILSIFFRMNNLGFSRYNLWNKYPTERFNVLGGITYSF